MYPVIITAGVKCPRCLEDGGQFHYGKDEIKSHPQEFYLCENCLKITTPEEMKELIQKSSDLFGNSRD